MTRATDATRAAARAAAEAFGGQPRVMQYWDEPEEHDVAVLIAEDRPAPGLTSYSTVTLHRHENRMDDHDIRVELATAADSTAEAMANVLATAAFNVIKDGWLAAPGVVFPGLIAEYGLSDSLPHVLWVPPAPWDALHAVDLGDGITAHWLLAIPISEAEREHLVRDGYERFATLLEQRDVAYWSLTREPLP
jgi:hypothetical protein